MSSNHLNCSDPRCLVVRKNARLCDVLGIWQAASSHVGHQGLVVCALHLHGIAACQTVEYWMLLQITTMCATPHSIAVQALDIFTVDAVHPQLHHDKPCDSAAHMCCQSAHMLVNEMVLMTAHAGSQVCCYLSFCPMQSLCAFELKLQYCVTDHAEQTA